MPDVVRQDEKVGRRIKRLCGAVQLAGEQGGEELTPGPAGPVQNQDGIADNAGGVAARVAERVVMDPQLGQGLTGREAEIADEEGVLIWLEYPTWHPQLTPKYEAELLREYKEFHQHDRNHPSVILRSLTCETGHGADLAVVQKLTDTAKKMIPGALVEDDSSWIEWNRVTDLFRYMKSCTLEEMIIWEALQSGCFSQCEIANASVFHL